MKKRSFLSTVLFLGGTGAAMLPGLVCHAKVDAETASAPTAQTSTQTSTESSDKKTSLSSQIRFQVEKYKLDNGLTVLLHEDHSVPLVSYQTWFRVGSKNEEPGYTGMAHLFEHMMFKGAKRYTGPQFDTILQANGATNNAFTTQDYTGYYENLPSSKLELVMDIESDRMENLQITPENLKSEREVVKEERRMRVDDNPFGVLRETMNATVFKVHPYRWPVIGFMKDLDQISVEKATQFYQTFYAPNNAVLVIAGDFSSAEAKKLIQKYYGAIKAKSLPQNARATEPQQKSPRSAVLGKEIKSTQFALAFRVPKSGTDESYELDLFANMLGAGQSSRAYQKLVYKDQIAAAVNVGNVTMQEEGLFQFSVIMKPGQDPEKAKGLLFAEINRALSGASAIGEAELEKSKNQVMKAMVDSLKTIHGRAELLAMNEAVFGDFERLFTDLEKYNAVTVPQIRATAGKFLKPENSTYVLVKPAKISSKQGAQEKLQ